MTEQWEPFNFEKGGVVKGISTDMLVLMLEKAGSTQGRQDIRIYPWIRAYKNVQEKPNTILYTTSRTQEREKMFKWVGPIYTIEFYVYALKGRHIRANSLKDLAKYKIGITRGDVREEILIKRAGVRPGNLEPVGLNIQNVRKLMAGRIDLSVHSHETLIDYCRKEGINPDLFEAVILLDKQDMYYAFHRDTPDSVIARFQKAFDDLKREGRLAELFRSYGRLPSDRLPVPAKLPDFSRTQH